MNEYMITTTDNPYDPFKDFTSCFMYDEEKGYHTCAYLGRIANTSGQLSDEENANEVERAIDEIIKYDFRNIYKKINNNSLKTNNNSLKTNNNSVNTTNN